jgi:hypothetical protein
VYVDANGDGDDDVLVGTPAATALGDGLVLLFHGVTGGLTTDARWRATGNGRAPGGLFGLTMAAADVDNDGFPDALVSAVGFDGPQVDEGAVFLFSGVAPPVMPLLVNDDLRWWDVFAEAVAPTRVTSWVRDPGAASGEILTMAVDGGTCSLRGAGALVVLECTVGGVRLTPAYGVLGSSLRWDGARHQVSVALTGQRAELWIDGVLADVTGASRARLGAAISAAAGTGSYALDSLKLAAN